VSQKIILRHKQRVLVLKYNDGKLDFPGGQLEWGEDLLSSLQRELKEELGISLMSRPPLFDVYNFISKKRNRHSVQIYYIYDLLNIKQITSPEQAHILWLNESELIKVIRQKDYIRRVFTFKINSTVPPSGFFSV